MVLVAGLRNYNVGTDTPNYVGFFTDILTLSDALQYGFNHGEYGFWIFTWLMRTISDQFAIFFIAIAIIVVGCYQWTIVKYSANWSISFFVFITMGFYSFFFNGARQGIACAIFALAIGPLLERNSMAYIGYVLLAFLFHKTALMMLPVYLIFDNNISIKKNLLILGVGVAGSAAFQRIVVLGTQVDDRYSTFGNTSEGGGYFTSGFTVVLGIFFFLFKKYVHTERERYGLFLNMFLFGAMISLSSAILSVNPSGFLRFAMYFNVSAIFLWAIVYENIVSRSSRMFFGYFFSTCYIVMFYLMTERFSHLVPYTFNPAISALLPFGG